MFTKLLNYNLAIFLLKKYIYFKEDYFLIYFHEIHYTDGYDSVITYGWTNAGLLILILDPYNTVLYFSGTRGEGGQLLNVVKRGLSG